MLLTSCNAQPLTTKITGPEGSIWPRNPVLGSLQVICMAAHKGRGGPSSAKLRVWTSLEGRGAQGFTSLLFWWDCCCGKLIGAQRWSRKRKLFQKFSKECGGGGLRFNSSPVGTERSQPGKGAWSQRACSTLWPIGFSPWVWVTERALMLQVPVSPEFWPGSSKDTRGARHWLS